MKLLENKKTRITFHAGILTIGGTIIEIQYENSRIFFDFGSEYNPSSEKQPKNLKDLLEFELAPKIDIYDKDIISYANNSKFENTAVFLSHVHLDHSKMVNYLDKDIPLYTLKGTKALLNTLNINNDFIFPLHKPSKKNIREIIALEENETIFIGEIEVTILPVDHDAFGAAALLIKTPDLTIAYSGDIRLHGYRESDSLEFCKKSFNCDILLLEGVTVSFDDSEETSTESDKIEREFLSEPEALNKINKIIEDNPNRQLTFNYYISNIERIINIAKTCKRELVLDAYHAYVVKEVSGVNIKYYSLDAKDYGLDKSLGVNFETLINDESNYFWQLDKLALQKLDSLKSGGIYIHSNAVPLGEFDPAYKPFMESFEKQGLEVISITSTGHAKPNDLQKIIDLIKPKLLIPIHSLKPERLINNHGERLLPEKGQTI